MSIKGIAIRVGVVLVIALTLPVVAQNWESSAMKAEREAREDAKRKQEEETARREAAAKASISTVTDPRDGRKYRTVKIGGKTWMAENLNYAIDGSGCYEDDASNCKKYGRLYIWDAAKDACRGMGGKWRLPTRGDWDNLANFAEGEAEVSEDARRYKEVARALGLGSNNLANFAEGEYVAGKKLKAKSGWDSNGNGTDDYGFSALPGGDRLTDGSFSYAGSGGFWWSASEGEIGKAYLRYMYYHNGNVYEYANDVRIGLSARCVAD